MADEPVVRDMLDVIIGEVVLFFNVGKTMVPAQIKSTINLILNDPISSSMTFEDYKVCFDNLKKGLYGKSFDRIDGQILLMCIHAYFEEKSAIVEQQNEINHDKIKNQSRGTDIIKDLGLDENNFLVNKNKEDSTNKPTPEQWKKLKEEINGLIKKVDTKPKNTEKTEQQKLIQRCFNHFDKLWYKKPYDRHDGKEVNGKFIKRYGRIMDVTEYVEYKLKQSQIINKHKK